MGSFIPWRSYENHFAVWDVTCEHCCGLVVIRTTLVLWKSRLLVGQSDPATTLRLRCSFDTKPIPLGEKMAIMPQSSWRFRLLQLLLQYRVDPRSREAVPTAEGSLWDRRRTVRRRTGIEAAASFPRCRRVILDCIAGI